MPGAKARGIAESKDPYSIHCSHVSSSVSWNCTASTSDKKVGVLRLRRRFAKRESPSSLSMTMSGELGKSKES
jgi:hypothetical protein